MDFERARSEKQKEQRIQEIISSTFKLFNEMEYDKITFTLIARENKSARSNIYKYFNTKEEIFLEILTRGIKDWNNQFISEFPKLIKNYGSNPNQFSQWWIKILTADKNLLKIMGLLNSTIEKNVSVESLRKFKRAYKVIVTEMTRIFLENEFFHFEESVFEFLVIQQSLLMGFAPMLHFTDKQIEVMRCEEIPFEQAIYMNYFVNSLTAVVGSLQKKRNE